MSTPLRIAVIGHDAAGAQIAGGLREAGADVIAFYPKRPKNPTTPLAESADEAVTGADLVLSLNSSTVAYSVAQKAAALLTPGALFADLNAGTPELKRHLASLFNDGAFVDVAVMKPVAGLGAKVPLAVAGPSAQRFIDL
ncbi:MAG: hypothetical protein RIR88_16, partial [Actinomycetota bacterium]